MQKTKLQREESRGSELYEEKEKFFYIYSLTVVVPSPQRSSINCKLSDLPLAGGSKL